MPAAVPERIRLAVEWLGLERGEHVLEIGCGGGVAAALVCGRLGGDGRMLAVDRSPLQVERARRRNAEHVDSGRLTLLATELAALDTGAERFDVAFAVNVNVFWAAPAESELEALRRALAPRGRLLLVYETPGADRAWEVATRVAERTAAAGFEAVDVLRGGPSIACCSAARPAGAQPPAADTAVQARS